MGIAALLLPLVDLTGPSWTAVSAANLSYGPCLFLPGGRAGTTTTTTHPVLCTVLVVHAHTVDTALEFFFSGWLFFL